MTAVGIAAIEYLNPVGGTSVEELERTGRVVTSSQILRSSGFSSCWIADRHASDLAREVIERLLHSASIRPEDVDVIINASAFAGSNLCAAASRGNNLDLFLYSTPRLQYELGMKNAQVYGISELGCISLISAVSLAKTLIDQHGYENVICVNADTLPADNNREVLYSVISDSACAVLVQKGAPQNRILAYHQLTKGFYWNCHDKYNELLASYYPTGKRLIHQLLSEQDISIDDIDLLIPPNVSKTSWEVFSQVIPISMNKIYTDNIDNIGHSVASDNFINLADALCKGHVRPGDKLLLFGFGLGAHWGGMLIEG